MRINGKRASEEKITQEIAKLLHGNGYRPYPLSVTETAKLLGVCRSTVYNYLKRIQSLEKYRERVKTIWKSNSRVIK